MISDVEFIELGWERKDHRHSLCYKTYKSSSEACFDSTEGVKWECICLVGGVHSDNKSVAKPGSSTVAFKLSLVSMIQVTKPQQADFDDCFYFYSARIETDQLCGNIL